jgi:radical SAM protein with 4Fe4S-binding SPASM domain
MCNVWKNPPQDELSADEYRHFFRNSVSNLRWLHLTGGEPFTRSDLSDIIAYALESCPNLRIIDLATNGFLPEKTRRVMEEVVRKYPRAFFEVGISIDGRPSIHERIRNTKGCWEKTQRTWNQLEDLSLRYKNFRVHVNFTITPWNVGELAHFCKESPQMSPVSISIYHRGHSFKNTSEQLPDLAFYSATKADISWFLKHGKETSFVKKLFLRLALRYLEEPSRQVLPCEACGASCFIDPKGDVYPCTLLECRLGNIREDPQLRFLNANYIKELRRNVQDGLCSCWSGCECWSSILKHMPTAIVRAYSLKISGNNYGILV